MAGDARQPLRITSHPQLGAPADWLAEAVTQPGPLALAVEWPLVSLPPGQSLSHSRFHTPIRRYLDQLMVEAAAVGQILEGRRTVSHLYVLGHPTNWLSPAELTELIYRLARSFHLQPDSHRVALIQVDPLTDDPELYPLLRGLGFTHLLVEDRRLEATNWAIRQELDSDCEALGLARLSQDPAQGDLRLRRLAGGTADPRANPAMMPAMAPAPLWVGLGAGAWTIVKDRVVQNDRQRERYVERWARGQWATRAKGRWKISGTRLPVRNCPSAQWDRQ